MPNVPVGTYSVELTSNSGTSNRITLNALQSVVQPPTVAAPRIASILPLSAKPGDTVTLFGTNFTGVIKDQISILNSTGSITPELVYTIKDTSVVFKMPNVPVGDYQIYLAADGGISNKVPFSVFIPKSTTPIE